MKERSALQEVFFVSVIPGFVGGLIFLTTIYFTKNGPIHLLTWFTAVIAAFYLFAINKKTSKLNFLKAFYIGFIVSIVFGAFIVTEAFIYNHFKNGIYLPVTLGDIRMLVIPVAISIIIGLLCALLIRGLQSFISLNKSF